MTLLLRGTCLIGLMICSFSLVFTACSSEGKVKPNPSVFSKKLENEECALCGMLVKEQPAPRGQVVHRDGHRSYLCSVGDLAAYIQMPSPHGSVQQAYVEASSSPTNLTSDHFQEWDWLPVEKAHYVANVPRRRVMGKPMLSFESDKMAKEAARLHRGLVLDWKGTVKHLTGR
jgi:copper chaperone NosL